jgi:hypothetical protein
VRKGRLDVKTVDEFNVVNMKCVWLVGYGEFSLDRGRSDGVNSECYKEETERTLSLSFQC